MADKEVSIESVVAGQKVYALSKINGWCLGSVTAVSEDSTSPSKFKAMVNLQGLNETVTVHTTSAFVHTVIDGSYDPRDSDLFKVGDLHVATLLFCLKERFERLGQQYSKMGEMILSVNPFQNMPFNGPQERDRYLTSKATENLPPHVWHIADKAYKQIVVRNVEINQSVVISGESGSGKTENTKALVGYLSQLSHRHSSNAVQRELADRVSDRLYFSNPILESFGNARTVRNDNSSRFGKYTKLFFDPQSGVMVGGEMVTYLLEKSRILTCAEGERCYHVYYEMLAGLPSAKKQQFKLKSVREYPGLDAGKTHTRRGTDGQTVDDASEFRTLCEAMDKMGIDSGKQDSIWRVLAAVLHLSEVTFGPDANDKAMVTNMGPLEFACTQLLGISTKEVLPCFLEKSRTKIMTTLCTVNEAVALRDAFAKALYIGVFDYLVATINQAIAPQEATTSRDRYIGVLDIFGFENFKKNSFEQLCINFANEGLANHYNKYTFLNDEAECKAEGIQIPPIVFPDNASTLNLLEQDKTGVFSLLDEECAFKAGTNQRFTSQVWEKWTKHSGFILPKSTIHDTFGIHHYANDVMYNTELWLEKNGDALKVEARDCIRRSTDPSGLINTLFDNTEVVASDGLKAKRVTVSSRFRTQLASLRSELEATESHFVRCIKPNMKAEPRIVENEPVGSQLESAGVLQTIALKRQGYPIRRPHRDFCGFFLAIAPKQVLPAWRNGDHASCAQKLLDMYTRLYSWKTPHYAVGRSKVFCKTFVWSKLEKLLLRKNRYRLKRCIPYLKDWIRRFRARKAEEQRRREEEQRLLQEQAARRAAMGAQETTVVARQSGLPEEKVKWFEEVSIVFATFDLPVLLDVCYNLNDKDKVLKALTEMQKQRIDDTLPATLKRVFSEAGIRDTVADHLIANGIVCLKKLSELSEEDMRRHGLNDAEIAGVKRRLLRQQGEALVNERLQQSIGTASFDSLLTGIKEQAHRAVDAQEGSTDVKLVKLLQMGFGREDAARALQQASGDLEVALNILMGAPPPAAAASPPPARTSQPSTGSQRQPTGASASPQQRQAQATYNTSGGDDISPPSYGHQAQAPPAQWQQQPAPPQQQQRTAPPPATRPPPPQSRPVGAPSSGAPPPPGYGQPASSVQQPDYGHGRRSTGSTGGGSSPQQGGGGSGGGAVTAANVSKLTAMGFPQEQAVRALQRSGNNVEAALNALLGA